VDKDSISQVLGVLSDKRSRELLYLISIDKSPSLGLQKKIHLSKKEFYSFTGKMLGNGLIRRNKGALRSNNHGQSYSPASSGNRKSNGNELEI
jgi:hypothetical protein